MEYINIKGINKKVSKVVYGCGSQPFWMGNSKLTSELLDAMIENDITTLDTARVYNNSEKMIGEWLKKSNKREEVVIISKCAHPNMFWRPRVNEKEIRKDLEKSLKLLNTNYIDILLLHRDDKRVPVSEVVDLFNNLIKEGKIKAYGASNWTYKRIKEANEYALKNNLVPMRVTSPQFALAKMEKSYGKILMLLLVIMMLFHIIKKMILSLSLLHQYVEDFFLVN